MSGTLVAGTIAGAVIGAAAPATAKPGISVDVTHNFNSMCRVTIGDLHIPALQRVKASMATTVEAPLVPGSIQPAHDVSVTLTMPNTLKNAASALRITHAEGHSPDSAVNIKLPIAPPGDDTTVTNRIALKNLAAPKARIPKKGKWKIVSTGTVPKIEVPGFAGNGSSTGGDTAQFSLPSKFTIKAKLSSRKTGKSYKSTMKCKVDKGDRRFEQSAPIVGAYVTDTVARHEHTGYRESKQIQLAFFHKPGATVPSDGNTWTDPKHGKLTPGANGLFTYKPNRNFVGKDSFTYTARDDSGESTSKVTIRVRKAPTKLKVRAPKSIRFGHRANVRVRVKTDGAAKGKLRLIKGKRVLDKAKVRGGKATLHIKRKALEVGKHKLRVTYAGSKTARKAHAKFTLRVKKRR